MRHGNISQTTYDGLKVLRQRIAKADIPPSMLDQTLNVATWNIREFGKKKRRKASLHYIAEIIYQFDLVALTEVRRDLSELKAVMDLLGRHWKVLFSDYIPDRGGNGERVAFVYDSRMVEFTGLAAEADPMRKKNQDTGEYESLQGWWRAPYMASFRAGNFDFILLCFHARWGKSEDERAAALDLLGKWIKKRTKDDHVFDKDFILMGDLNIPDREGKVAQALTQNGLRIPKPLMEMEKGTNLNQNRYYDQVFYNPRQTDGEIILAGNVLDFADEESYADGFAGAIEATYPGEGLSKHEYTFELSDHLPLWVQLDTDREDEALDQDLNRN